MSKPWQRREFLRRTLIAGAAAATFPGREFLAVPRARPKVVHVHHGRAARWNRTTGMYRDFLDQAAVNQMLDQAVSELKGGGPDVAWGRVFALPGNENRRLSIKISCNNATDSTDGAGNDIDAIPEPVIAVIGGFLRAGGSVQNVNVYDGTNTAPTRYIGTWFRNRVTAAYPGVLFNAAWPGGGANCDPSTCVTWDPAWGANTPPDMKLSGAVVSTDYVVNVPIVKRHGQANVSLGFKNHFGSVDRCDRLHSYVFYDTPAGSVLADIMGSPYVAGNPAVVPLWQKTVLTVGDMLFGQPCRNFDATPRPWKTWGNEWPNCLVVSDDVVAADSVMFDLVEAEPPTDGGCGSIQSWGRRYLQVAEAKGQGVFEHVVLPSGTRFDPLRMTYAKIDYRWVDVWSSGAALTVTRAANGTVVLTWEHYFPGPCEVWRASKTDFSNGILLGSATTGRFVDPRPPEPALYRIRYVG